MRFFRTALSAAMILLCAACAKSALPAGVQAGAASAPQSVAASASSLQLESLYASPSGRSAASVSTAYAHVEDIDAATPLQRALQYGNGVYGGVEGIAQLLADPASPDVYYLLRHGDGEHLFTPVAQAAPGGVVTLTPTCASGGSASANVQSLAIGPQNVLATTFAASDIFPRSGITFGIGAACRVLDTDELENTADIALGDALVFADGDSVDASTLQLTRNPNAARPDAFALTRGPDGNVWALNAAHNCVLRIATPTSSEHFTLPQGSTLAANAVLAPYAGEGLVFTAQTTGGSAEVGYISTSGAIVMLPIPVLANASGIAAGRDGGLWIVGTGHDGSAMLARVDVDRAVASLSVTAALHLSSAAEVQGGIVRASDGSLWFGVQDFYGFGAPNDVYLHLLHLT